MNREVGIDPRSLNVCVRPLSRADGGGFEAIGLDLPGCRSDGETPHEALTNAYDAIACWVEAAKDLGRTIPRSGRD